MTTARVTGAVAAASLLGAVGCFAMAWRSAEHRHLVPFSSGQPGADPAQVGPHHPSLTSTVAVHGDPPVRVDIPALGFSARVVPVGLTRAGRLAMPPPSVAGWYRWSPARGTGGPAVLVGHVDSAHGPAVFYRLSAVQTGETVRVVGVDGSTSTFAVSKITVVSKSDFPTRAVFRPTARPVIRLITCTGPFDTRTGYADSLIVWGRQVES